MIDLIDISNKIKDLIIASSEGKLNQVDDVYNFMLPPRTNFPAVVAVPFDEDMSYYPSKYLDTERRFNIEVFDFGFNKRESRENSIKIIEGIKNEFENNFNLGDLVNYVNMAGSSVTSSRPINNKFLSSSILELSAGVRDKIDGADYTDFDDITNGVSAKEIKDKLVDILISDNDVNFNVGQITDINASNTMNTPSLIVDIGDEDYTYHYNNFALSQFNTTVLILTRYYFKQEAFEYAVNVLEGVKQTIRENYNLDGLSHYVRLDSVEFDVDRLAEGSDFYQFTTLNLSIFVKEN
jgi:hypothetical protein